MIATVDYMLDKQVEICYDHYFGPGVSTTNLPSTLNYSIALNELSEGTHTLRIFASSRSYIYYAALMFLPGIPVPNSTSTAFSSLKSGWHEINFTVDTVSPKIIIQSPLNITYQQSESFALNFTINKPIIELSYSLDGQQNKTVGGNITLAGLPSGPHKITVYGLDEAGNVGVSETQQFNVAQHTIEPFPTGLAIALASLVIVGISLLIYFKKRGHANKYNIERQTK